MRARGFTLLEVMIALLVVALTLAAATGAVGGAARQQTGLVERTFATWAAQNLLTRLRLEGLADTRVQEEQVLAGRRFRVEATAQAQGSLRRIELAVRGATGDTVLARLTGFLPMPTPESKPAPEQQPVPVRESDPEQVP